MQSRVLKTSSISLIMLLFTIGLSAEPIYLSEDTPLLGMYFFTHWWDPWKSSDSVVESDLDLLKSMGYNTIFLDHEWSQAIDDWSVFDRDHKLAKKAGMQILPWLSLKVWQDIGTPAYRKVLIKRAYDVNLELGTNKNGKPSRTKPYDPAVVEAGVQYCSQYLARYLKDGAILRVKWKGKLRPVIALSAELGWEGSYDPLSQQMFQAWVEAIYGMDLDKLNKAWGTSFSSFDKIDWNDSTIFDLDGYKAGKAQYPKAVEDHIEFRSQTVNCCLNKIKERLIQKHPDLLIAAELPYQIGSLHPDAISYRVSSGANPSAAYHADILVIRATDTLTDDEQRQLLDYKKKTGQKIILTYRTYNDWREQIASGKMTNEDMSKRYADQASKIADGFGFYSWNEMVDTHIIAIPKEVLPNDNHQISHQPDALIDALKYVSQKYRQKSLQQDHKFVVSY